MSGHLSFLLSPLTISQLPRRTPLLLAALVLTLSASLAAPQASASVTLVQHASKDAGVTNSSSLAFPANNTAGNWIGVVIRGGHTGQVFTVSDTRGNSYKQAVQFNQTLDAPNGETLAIYYAENIVGGANTVTVAESLANNTLRFAILEYSGVATSNSLDVTSAAQGSGTTLNSGAATTTIGGDLILGEVTTASGNTYTAGSGYTIEDRVPAAPNTKLISEDAVQAVAGAVSVGATLSISDNGGALLAAFKAASGTLPPSITSLTPASGPVGTSVTIAGANFGASQGTSTVTFNGVSAGTAGTWSATSITVNVPTGATTGNVVVTVGGVASNGVAFTVTPPPPSITSLTPNSGPAGTSVTIAGTNFGATQGTSQVTFNGTAANPTSWSSTSIVVPAPTGVSTGNVIVIVGGLWSNAVLFTVPPPPPSIASLSPTSGPVGTSVTINGGNWGASQGTSTVTFNGVAATPTSWNVANIVAPVPTGATTGNVVVTVGGVASNGAFFTVPPTITGLSPNSGLIGTSVTISGSNFGTSQGGSSVTFNGIYGTPTSWSQTSIVVPVPNAASTGNVVVAVQNTSGYVFASNSVLFTVLPSITGLSPTIGATGTLVTISGASFGATQGTSTVTFNGTLATPTSWNSTTIGVPVPSGATTGNVVVTVGGVSSNGVAFTVIPSPTITSLNPTSGPIGASVTITGTNFGASQGTGTVSFNGVLAAPISWSQTSIVVPVPNGPSTGNVVVIVSGVASNGVMFTVTNPGPNIISLSPNFGPVGTSVAITGSNFGATQGTSTVTFNGTASTPTSWNATSIAVPVPANATSGNVIVTVGGVPSNNVSFIVTPTITNLSPSSGPVATSVTITGTSFGASQGNSTVTFNGVSAGVASTWSATSIVVSVPNGATSGNVVVTVGGGASNGMAFTVTPGIFSLSPTSGPAGTSVTITGSNFGTSQGTSTVTFNGTVATPTSWIATSIVVPVPSGATAGNVIVTVSGQASNGMSFTVLPTPSITSLSPTFGPVGTLVTITGTNFGATQSAGFLAFNGVNLTPSSWSPTTITVVIPAGATTGDFVVTLSGVASNAARFTVTPIVITSIAPASGLEGMGVTITGTNFGPTQGTSTVTFNGTLGTAQIWNGTSVALNVPIGATTGNVVVTVGGVPSNGFPFTVSPLTVSVAPAAATLSVSGSGGSALFQATVTNDINNSGVGWSLLGACSGISCGLVTPGSNLTATYIAPTSLPNPPTVTLTAKSNTDPAKTSTATINLVQTPAPTLSSLTPNSGPAGTSMTITGTGFGATQGQNALSVGNRTAVVTSWSDTSIVAVVPSFSGTGSVNVQVQVNGLYSNILSFTLVTAPSISTLTPNSGPAGTSVTIAGANFGATQGTSTVTFNGTAATPTSWSDTSIVVSVPTGATMGSVVVTVNGVASNGVNFTVNTVPVPIKLVQRASKDAGTTSPTSLAFPAANTAGNWIAVVIRGGKSGQVFSVSDSPHNTYHTASQFNITVDTPNGDTLAIFYAENIAGGANTVTVANSISGNTIRFAILEYSGVAPASSIDVVATNQGTSTTPTSGNATTTANGDLLLGTVMTGGPITFTAGSGYTTEALVPAEPNSKLIVEDRIQAAAGSASAGATLNVSDHWGAILAAFKAALGGGVSGPSISSLTPNSGTVGTSVTIAGANFGATQGTSTVTFNGITAPPTSWSATSIVAPVPTGATTGNVVVTVGGTASNGVGFTVTPPPPIAVTLTPVRGGVTISQPLSLSAAVQNDSSNAGVTWSVSGGALSNQTISSTTFSAAAAGVYTITATSKADVTKSASTVVGVTDLAGVPTWRNDNSRSGINSQEYALTQQNVTSSSFGKLFSCPVDGQIYAQPLWMANVPIAGTPHNVVFIATENDSLYAFDADGPGCKAVWSTAGVSLIPSGEVIVPFADVQNDNALGPIVGITGTPVIDPTSQTIYLVAFSEGSSNNVIPRLHAIDITTGKERAGSPVIISASVSGASGYDNSGGTITFAPKFQKQRPALLLLNGVIYIAWAGFLDTDFYHGWLMGYDATTLVQVTVFNDTIDGGRGGIWMSGGGPAADSQGNIYLLSGNGDFNANTTGGRNYGDTFLKLGTSGGLSVSDWFTPHDQNNMAVNDLDLGGGSAVVLIDQPSGPFPHLVLGGSKGGLLYVVSRDNLGHYNSTNDSQIVQSFLIGSNGIYSAPLFWQNTLYAAASGTPLSAFPFSTSTSQFTTSPSSTSSQSFSYPGTTPVLSASGSANAIVWVLQRTSATTPAVLHAYDPTNLKNEFWNSSQAAGSRDQAGNAVRFFSLAVANGKVYIGTQAELDVYGLLPN